MVQRASVIVEHEAPIVEREISSESAILRGTGLTLTSTAVGGAIALANEIMIARQMGPSTYGLFALAFVLARIGNGVALFGLGAAVLHYLPVYCRRGDSARVVGTVFGALLLPLVIGVAGMALLWGLAPWLAVDVFHKPEAADYIRLLAPAIPLMAVSEIFGLIVRGLGYSWYYVLISNLVPRVALTALLWPVRAYELDAIWVAVAVSSSYGAAVVLGAALVVRTVGRDLWRSRPAFELDLLYRYAVPVLAGTCLYLIMEWADLLILGRLVSADQVGLYRACIQVCVVFDMIILATNLAAAHIFPVLEHEKRTRERNETYRHVTLLVALLSAPAFFLLSLHASEILALLGPNFSSASLVLIIMAGGRLIRNGLGTSAFLLVLSGHQGVETKNAATASILNIVLNLALIPPFGVLGAVVATTAAEIALNLMRTWQVRRLMDVHMPWRLLARLAVVGVVVTAGVEILTPFLSLDQARPAALLVNGAAAAGILVVAFWFVGVERKDRAFVIRGFQ